MPGGIWAPPLVKELLRDLAKGEESWSKQI